MSDPEIVTAATDALLAHRAPMEDGSTAPVMRAILDAEAVLEAVEPLIRANEREREAVRRDLVEERSERLEQRLLSIYKNVEHKRDMLKRYIDYQKDKPGSFIAVDVGRREALDDVLALFETEAYQKRVGSNE